MASQAGLTVTSRSAGAALESQQAKRAVWQSRRTTSLHVEVDEAATVLGHSEGLDVVFTTL